MVCMRMLSPTMDMNTYVCVFKKEFEALLDNGPTANLQTILKFRARVKKACDTMLHLNIVIQIK
jgi:hypothetical protein